MNAQSNELLKAQLKNLSNELISALTINDVDKIKSKFEQLTENSEFWEYYADENLYEGSLYGYTYTYDSPNVEQLKTIGQGNDVQFIDELRLKARLVNQVIAMFINEEIS